MTLAYRLSEIAEEELYDFLEAKYSQYNRPSFIDTDPISVPHRYTRKEDIEISGLFSATLAWGQRSVILKNANEICDKMDDAPYGFILNFQSKDLQRFKNFKHRTFNFTDIACFCHTLKNIYKNYGGIESVFSRKIKFNHADVSAGLNEFREVFFSSLPKKFSRTRKHISSPQDHSACKRLSMYLRWMVRRDSRGVDFGIWKSIRPSQLICPMDIHVSRTAKMLGLVQRNIVDWKAALELTESLKRFDADDPVKYDFALFGLGIYEKWATNRKN